MALQGTSLTESAMETSGFLESRQIMFSFRIITTVHDVEESNVEAPRVPLQISLVYLNRYLARCVARDRMSSGLDVTTVEKLAGALAQFTGDSRLLAS